MTTSEILQAIPRLHVLVAGDVCLDRWCRYDPDLAEPSRETGIPRIAVISTEVTPGAAGTIANNLAALRVGQVDVLGIAGNDGFGHELVHALRARGIGTDLVLRWPDIPTFTYTKLLNARTGQEDLPRLDFVHAQSIPEDLDRALVARFEEAAPNYDVILISDQAETSSGGGVTPRLRAALAHTAAARPEAVIWVDSRMRAEHFRGVIVKPNFEEAKAASMRAIGRVDFAALRAHTAAPLLIVTQGAEGAIIVGPTGQTHVPTQPVSNPVDICGAGDSFSAGAALAWAVTRDPVPAARFGNQVAAITIMKKGTGVASPEELMRPGRGGIVESF